MQGSTITGEQTQPKNSPKVDDRNTKNPARRQDCPKGPKERLPQSENR